MNRLLIFFLFLVLGTTTQAQINELGIFAGGSNYIGDIGPTNYINPNKLALGFLYKWNRSTRHSYRFSYTHARIASNDLDASAANRHDRGYSFKNTINEFSAGLEFNFFNFDLHNLDNQFTPYIYTGLSYFSYNELYHLNSEYKKDDREGTFAIPMTVGIKSRFAKNFVIGFEISARYTFTDNLDGSNPKNDNLSYLKFGNINSKDWYVFTGFTLTYTFGENPCFCPN